MCQLSLFGYTKYIYSKTVKVSFEKINFMQSWTYDQLKVPFH